MSLQLRLFALLMGMVLVSVSYAQPSPEILPKSQLLSARLLPIPLEVSFPFDAIATSKLDYRDDKAGHMPKFARTVPTDISLTNAGTWTTLPDGGRVWRIQISSPGALALIPCFDQFYIPEGATLHIYDPAKEEVIGAFTAANNPADGMFNSGLIHGDVCILEYYEPLYAAGTGKIHLNELGHAYRMVPARRQTRAGGVGFGASVSCEVNVKCTEGNNWTDQKNAVMRMLVKQGSTMGWCSASLVNNANQDCTPYVLSADHCYQDELSGVLSSPHDLSQWLFYFHYESSTCADPVSEGALGNNFMTGCMYKAASLDMGGNNGSDFVLLQLDRTPPTTYTPFYAGWSNINTTSSSGVAIHHPSADIKKISTYNTSVQSTSWGGIVSDTHWQVLWAATAHGHGVTEPGSSGSPLFDANKHIIGTLTGGSSDCASPSQNDFFGKFAFHWLSNGNTASKRLQDWLDPYNTGIQTLDGVYSPCSAAVALDAGISSIHQKGNVCDTGLAVTFTLTNYGSATLHTDNLNYSIDGGAPQQLAWSGSLSTFQSVDISLPAITFAPGSHTITISSLSPNGSTDANTVNDSRTTTLNMVPSSGQFFLDLLTGDLGAKITWELTDLQNNVLYSGGPYTDTSTGTEIFQAWCLPQACYRFNIYSAANNGLTGSSMNGTYNISDPSGAIIAQNGNVNFGAIETISFCETVSGINSLSPVPANINIYPNPSTGIFTITNVPNAVSLTVSDALGRVVTGEILNDKTRHQVDLSGQESGVYFFKFNCAEGSAVKKVILNSGK
jgi:lysyl endopeptidase